MGCKEITSYVWFAPTKAGKFKATSEMLFCVQSTIAKLLQPPCFPGPCLQSLFFLLDFRTMEVRLFMVNMCRSVFNIFLSVFAFFLQRILNAEEMCMAEDTVTIACNPQAQSGEALRASDPSLLPNAEVLDVVGCFTPHV